MKPRRVSIGASLRLLGAVFTVAMMTSCHSKGEGDLCCIPIGLEGTITGLVGSNLVLATDPQSPGLGFAGASQNGMQVLLGFAIVNTVYNLTIRSQPTSPAQTCVITNGAGTAGTANVTNIAVTCTTNPPRFAYVANRGSNNISAYTLDPGTGTLAAIPGSPFAAGGLPIGIAVDQSGHFAYVVNQIDATLSAFSIDRNSGALIEIGGSPFATGLSPTSVAIDPSSSFVYVANGGAGTVSAYTIGAGGALTEITGSPYAVGNSPSCVVVDAVGNYIHVTNKADWTFSTFSIQIGAGSLMVAPGSPIATGKGPQAVVTDPSAAYVYVANGAGNTLMSFAAVGTGAAFENGDSPYPTGSTPYSIAVDAAGHFVYVVNQGSDTISGFDIRNGGVLAPLAASPFVAGSEPSSVAVEPTGKFAYVVNTGSGTVSVYAIDATSGALTPVTVHLLPPDRSPQRSPSVTSECPIFHHRNSACVAHFCCSASWAQSHPRRTRIYSCKHSLPGCAFEFSCLTCHPAKLSAPFIS